MLPSDDMSGSEYARYVRRCVRIAHADAQRLLERIADRQADAADDAQARARQRRS